MDAHHPSCTEVVTAYLRHLEATNHCCQEALNQKKRRLNAFAATCQFVAGSRAYQLSDWIESQPRLKSTATRKACANQVNACFNWAVRQGRIDSNPFRSVTYSEADPRPCMPDDALDAILAHANKPFERIVRFLVYTGCRLSEACTLHWHMIDWQRKAVVLAQHKGKRKTGKSKAFALTSRAIDLLNSIKGECGLVFVNTRGTPWNRGTLGQQLRRMKKKGLVLTDATLHGVRHAFGTRAVREGASIKMVSLQLGHSSTVITERYYVHLNEEFEAMREAAERGSKPTL